MYSTIICNVKLASGKELSGYVLSMPDDKIPFGVKKELEAKLGEKVNTFDFKYL